MKPVDTAAGGEKESLPSGYLPRLPREYYQGDAVVHWTLTTLYRRSGWLTEGFHSTFRELLLHAAAREGLFCPVYCLMTDHLHLIWMGLRRDSDQCNAMSFLRTYLQPALAPARFQHQPQDRVLRAEQRRQNAFAEICQYLLENPVRAGLVSVRSQWSFHGAIIPGYPTLHPLQQDYWEKHWKLYWKQRQPDAGDIKRPPFNWTREQG